MGVFAILSSFYAVKDASPGGGATEFQVGFPPSMNLINITPKLCSEVDLADTIPQYVCSWSFSSMSSWQSTLTVTTFY